MKILNARLGFANNSSSSHSMIIVSKEQYRQLNTESTDGDYGWDDFTLADPESKLDYLASAIYQQLKNQGNDISALVVVRDLLNLPTWVPLGYGIDHQSTFELPASDDGSPVDLKFARAFADWIQSEGVVVLGGNDNSDGHPLSQPDVDAMPFARESSNHFTAKHDSDSGSWTLFNRKNGAKLRMSFEPGEALILRNFDDNTPTTYRQADEIPPQKTFDNGEPPKMATPELVDVKITDYCDIGCGYCYQGSTRQGRHAKLDDIKSIARQLFKAGVLEVALGGGEPTRHPQFAQILEIFNEHGIVANFTTRDLSFMDDPLLAARIFSASKSVAISVSSAEQIQAAELKFKNGNHYQIRSYQYVIGTASDDQFEQIIQTSVDKYLNLTLLGYKDTGRGQAWREGVGQTVGKTIPLREHKVNNQSTEWIKTVQHAMGDRSYSRICIDTALARESEQQLGSQNIPRHLWHKSEGLVSMYVDAVSMKMGISSYEDVEKMIPFDSQWTTHFQHWAPSVNQPSRNITPRKKGVAHG